MVATLKMIAEATGVSIRTAGRALHSNGAVRPELAARIRQVARELSYIPNVAARNLRGRTCRIIGVIGANSHHEAWLKRFSALELLLRSRDLHPLLASMPVSLEATCQLLREWSGIVQYVIFSYWNESWDPAPLLQLPMRCIFLDCDPGSDKFDRVLTDRSYGVQMAVRSFLQKGRKRIVHVNGNSAGRSAGFEAAIRQAHAPVEVFQICTKSLEFEDGYCAGDQILQGRADAAFFDTDRMALGFYRYAHEHGIEIPRHVAVAGFDNDTAGAFAIPALTSVVLPTLESVERVVEMVTAPDTAPPQTVVFKSKLIARDSG